MKQILAAGEIQLTKSLGQNFLHDGNQLRRIVEAGQLTPADKVLEIGPGLGPLTELLMAQAGEVLAIEKDARLVAVLRERFPSLVLLHDDALDYLQRQPRDWREWKLVANLPYSVASPLLVELAQASLGPRRMVATLQLEVARRLMARAGEADSACVCLVRRDPALLEPEARPTFVKVIKRSFSQRRKMMLKLLRGDWPTARLQAAFADLNLSPQIRAEAVSLEHFCALARRLHEPR
jgi:16S rRNA (adenine1518-N6/adenine1519-N6)-dimethyltransferase